MRLVLLLLLTLMIWRRLSINICAVHRAGVVFMYKQTRL